MTNTHFESFDEIVEALRSGSYDEEIIFKVQSFLVRKNVTHNIATNLSEFSFSRTDFVVNLIRTILPNARYGFDYSPSTEVKFNKEGKQVSAPGQGWVKLPAIDWSIADKDPGKAMLIAFLLVLRDLEKMNEVNVPKPGESI